MFRKGIFLAACILAMTGSARSDEPGRSEKIKNQRVSSQLLKVTLAIPIAQEAVPVPPVPSYDSDISADLDRHRSVRSQRR
jgi:hypothetical protein